MLLEAFEDHCDTILYTWKYQLLVQNKLVDDEGMKFVNKKAPYSETINAYFGACIIFSMIIHCSLVISSLRKCSWKLMVVQIYKTL